MDAIVKFLEKHQPLFDKISRNIYLVAIKDGFLSNMPIVLFSSLFLLLSTLPAYVGITLPSEVLDFFNKIWLFGGFCGRDSGIGPAQRAKTTIWN